MINYKGIIENWNSQTDEFNQWDSLSEEEKIDFTIHLCIGKSFKFFIDCPGELAAGINSYTDTITIMVESGDPGGDESGEDSFCEFMRSALAEWYDGARVNLK